MVKVNDSLSGLVVKLARCYEDTPKHFPIGVDAQGGVCAGEVAVELLPAYGNPVSYVRGILGERAFPIDVQERGVIESAFSCLVLIAVGNRRISLVNQGGAVPIAWRMGGDGKPLSSPDASLVLLYLGDAWNQFLRLERNVPEGVFDDDLEDFRRAINSAQRIVRAMGMSCELQLKRDRVSDIARALSAQAMLDQENGDGVTT